MIWFENVLLITWRHLSLRKKLNWIENCSFRRTSNQIFDSPMITFYIWFSTVTDGKGQGCTTISGPSSNLPCIFPFKFGVRVYKTCTWVQAHLTGNKAWCSTAVDKNGHHLQGKWGNCNSSCLIEPSPMKTPKGTGTLTTSWKPVNRGVTTASHKPSKHWSHSISWIFAIPNSETTWAADLCWECLYNIFLTIIRQNCKEN